MSHTDDRYKDIRPYTDDEVRPALQRLINNDEFINILSDLHPMLQSGWLRPIKKYLIQRNLSKITSGINNVNDVQLLVKKYLDDMIDTSVDTFSVSGIDQLMADDKRPCLFIGNHRDIVLDPALINYALHIRGYDTVRIAIGDNLLSTSFVGDLMKLNKSFVVKRSLSAPREKLMALKDLSSYMHHSLTAENSSIWIAQSEGRAKDGKDRTQPAILKMIAMSKDRETSFGAYIKSLRIVPVAISYQYDPCDADKAKELYQRAQTGTYKKSKNEDFESIMKGLNGYKGNIHVAFGQPLQEDYPNAEAAAQEIDQQIHNLYKLSDTNTIALNYLSGDVIDMDHDLHQRIESMPAEHRPYAWAMYANAAKPQMKQQL